jgi:hypothetical protein
LLLAAGINPSQIEEAVPGVIAVINETDIVAQIITNVEASLDIFEACNDGTTTPPPINGAATPILGGLQLPTIQQMNPTIQQNSQQVLPFGDSMVQLH